MQTQTNTYIAPMATPNIHTDFSGKMSYGDYLHLDTLLIAQHALSEAHDELLFITIHSRERRPYRPHPRAFCRFDSHDGTGNRILSDHINAAGKEKTTGFIGHTLSCGGRC